LGTITYVPTQDAVLALTFDDGPHPEFTPRLLKILEKYQAYATFFMVGETAQKYPALVRQVVEAGHEIGNHSWNHPSFPLISGRERRAQIGKCAQVLAPYGQRLFRPPHGHQSFGARLDAWRLGYQVVTWNIVAQDWLDHDANWMVNRVLDRLKPGSIILFHDSLYYTVEQQYVNREPTLTAVNMLLEQLSDQFRFVTISELLRHGRPTRRSWYQKGDLAWLNSLKRAVE
jgi:peptidoglycan/xylan/chitin deacetylase (PgdA/CDA1 family)